MYNLKQLLIIALVGALAACNTIHGAGEDISSGGQAISKAATTTQEKM